MSKSLVAAIVIAASTVASASPSEDLSSATQDNTHDKVSGWVIERLVTVKVGTKCWAQVLDKKTRGIAQFTSYARRIEGYAKTVTGDDWIAIEATPNTDKAKSQAVVDKMVTAFAPKFHLTIVVDGDDCDASGNALWLSYVGTTLDALAKYPPSSGIANVTIHADASAKGVKTEISKDGTTFTVTGSKDVQASGWAPAVEKAIQRVSQKG